MSENLARNLATTARDHGGRLALRLDGAAMTYAQLDEATARPDGVPAAPVRPAARRSRGDHAPQRPAVRGGLLRALRAGAVVVPMNTLLKRREVAFYVGDPEAALVVAWHGVVDEAQAGAAEAGAQCLVSSSARSARPRRSPVRRDERGGGRGRRARRAAHRRGRGGRRVASPGQPGPGDRHSGGAGAPPRSRGPEGQGLGGELARVASGRSELRPGKGDRRFSDPAWETNWLLRRLLQAHLAAGGAVDGLISDADTDWRTERRPPGCTATSCGSRSTTSSPRQAR